jgi:hypothetical protein
MLIERADQQPCRAAIGGSPADYFFHRATALTRQAVPVHSTYAADRGGGQVDVDTFLNSSRLSCCSRGVGGPGAGGCARCPGRVRRFPGRLGIRGLSRWVGKGGER